MERLIAQYWTKEQQENLGGPKDEYLLELMSIALEALEEKAPKRLEKMSMKTLAMYLYNQTLSALNARNQIYNSLIDQSFKIPNIKERRMAQMIAQTDSDEELERLLREVEPD